LIKRDWDLLFFEYDLDSLFRHQLSTIRDVVIKVPLPDFESTSDEFLSARVASQLVVQPLEFAEDRISVASRDVKIDVSRDFSRGGWGDEPVYANGIEVTYHLPFSGDAQLLKCRPNPFTANPPRAVIGSSELRFPYDQADGDAKATKSRFTEDLKRLKEWVAWQKAQIETYNSTLEQQVRAEVAARRLAVDKRKTDIESLGFAVHSAKAPTPPPEPGDRARAREGSRAKGRRTFDVALSFAGEDRPHVEQVAKELEALGIGVFYDRFEQVNLWGADLAKHLGNVYGRDSRFVVMFLSKSYAAKAWPDHEKSFALGRHLKGDVGRILPVRFDDTAIEGLPPTLGYLDLRVLTPQKLAELIRQKVDNPES
jgi:TIR domain